MRRGCRYLEHLNESHAQVKVCLVTANQAHREKDSDRDDSAEVNTAGHGHFFPGIENGGEAGKDLGHDGRKDKMPCCQEDGYENC